MSRANVNAYASSTAFFMFLSLIPMMMLISSILSFTPLLQKSDLQMAVQLLPPSIAPFFFSMIESVYGSTFGVVSVAAIVTVWSAGKGVLALMRGIASFYLIVFLAAIVFLLIVMVFGNLLAGVIVRHIPRTESLFELLLHFRGIVSWCVMTLLFAAVYTWVPNCRLRFKRQIPGAVFSSTTWNVFSWGFSIYVRQFHGFSMYGSLTVIVIVMLWLYFCFYLLLVGAHINRFLMPFAVHWQAAER